MTKKSVEIFSAGCPACEDTIELVNTIADGDCTISILDMKDPAVAQRAKGLGIGRVPAVVVDGRLAAIERIDRAPAPSFRVTSQRVE